MSEKWIFSFELGNSYIQPGKLININFLIIFSFLLGSSAYLRMMPFVSTISIACSTIIGAFFFVKLFNEKRNMRYVILLIIFYVWCFISTYLGTRNNSIYMYASQAIGVTVYICYMIEDQSVELLRAIRDASCTILLINLFCILIKPNGFIGSGTTAYYFLGFRIGFTPFVMVAVISTLLWDYSNKKIFSIHSVINFSVALATVIIKNVGTGIVSLAAIIGLIIIYKILDREIFSLWLVYILYIIGFIAIVIYEIQFSWKPLSFLLVDVLQKDITFDNRTYIWNSTILDIMEKPITGHGIDNTVLAFFVYNTRVVSQHNQILNLLDEVGIIGFLAFVILLLFIGFQVNSLKDKDLKLISVASIVSILLVFFTEIQTTRVNIFIILALLANIKSLEKNNEKICVNHNT